MQNEKLIKRIKEITSYDIEEDVDIEEVLEELLTINEQAKILLPKLKYTNALGEKLFDCLKNKTKINRDIIQKAHNNYLVLCIIGINQCNSAVFKKLDDYMENEN